MTDDMIERVARAIAGEDWDDIPDNKSHWVEQRGEFGGRYRAVSEPFKGDYLDQARAAIEAMREPTDEMFATAAHYIGGADRVRKIWGTIIDAALQKAPQSR